MNIELHIEEFLKKQTVASVCLTDADDHPYCFQCFYAYDSKRKMLYFKTSMKSHHGLFLQTEKRVAGSIQPDKLNKAAIQGLQFSGTLLSGQDKNVAGASSIYHKTYPFALMMPGELWVIKLLWMKLTDNTLSFGKKLIWEVNETAPESLQQQ